MLWWLLHGFSFAFASLTCTPFNTWQASGFGQLVSVLSGSDACVFLPADLTARSTLQVSSGSTFKIFSSAGVVLDGAGAQILSVLGDLILENLTVQNGAASTGGAVNVQSGTLEAYNVQFLTNVATSSGGAVWSVDSAKLLFEDCTFQGNSAQGGGGAGAHLTGTVAGSYTFRRCFFLDHVASAEGGALRLEVPSSIDLYDVIFENNTASYSNDLWTNVQMLTTVNLYGSLIQDYTFDILYGTCGSSCTDPTDNYGQGAGCQQVLPYDSGWLTKFSDLYGASGTRVVHSVDVDVFGNVILAGEAQSGRGDSDVVVVSLDSRGAENWRLEIDYLAGNADDVALGLCTDDSGAIYLTGWTDNGQMSGTDILLLILSKTGDLTQTWDHGSNGNDQGIAVQLDGSGNIFLAGSTNFVLGAENLGGVDIFVMKINPGGPSISWLTQLGSSADDYPSALHVDTSGSCVVAGETSGAFTHPGNSGGKDIFVVKLSSNSNLEWSYQTGSAANDHPRALSVHDSGIFVAGSAEGSVNTKYWAGGDDILVIKLTTAGAEGWTYMIGTSSHEGAYAIQVDAQGDVLLAGNGWGGLDGYVLAGQNDIFLQKVSAAGAHVWTRMFGTVGEDSADGLALDALGNAVIAGSRDGDAYAQKVTGISSSTCYLCFPCYYCTKGQYRWNFAGNFTTADCQDCPAGEMNALDGNAACSKCPAGTYQAALGSSECISCPFGSDSSEGSACCSGHIHNAAAGTCEACQSCERCPRGFFCEGGFAAIAGRVACATGRTTVAPGAVHIDACICNRGYRLDPAVGSCVACAVGFYKSAVENAEVCEACPANLTTFAVASVSASSCYSTTLSVPAPSPGPQQGADGEPSNESNETNSSNDTAPAPAPAPPPVGTATRNVTEVPAVTFSLALGNIVFEDPEQLQAQLTATISYTVANSARVAPNSIVVEILGLSSGRRLSELSAVVVMNKRTQQEAEEAVADMDVDAISSELTSEMNKHPDLGSLGLFVTVQTIVRTTTSILACALSRAVPPGFPVLSPADCQCAPGYGYDQSTQTCNLCREGEYKGEVGNVICAKCPTQKTTPRTGSTSEEQCACQEGLATYPDGSCSECPQGSYCPGENGQAFPCPANSTTLLPGRTKADCVCLEGYYYASAELFCVPCQRGRYKTDVGNHECPFTCPTNAESEPGSTSQADCFCRPNFHAVLVGGKLESCSACSYQGLTCLGGWTAGNSRLHSQPLAMPGFYQTGHSSAEECNILMSDGSSVCRGGQLCAAQLSEMCFGDFGNACAPGGSGMQCGECGGGWARESFPKPCQPCPPAAGAFLAVGIISDVFFKALLNFVIAAMAATSAVRDTAKLHTSLIRIGLQWLAACSVLGQFSLEQLTGFEWASRQWKMARLQECSASNATDCAVGQEVVKFAWPEEISNAMREIFAVMNFVPQLASVDLSIQCHVEELSPGNILGKMIAPGVYYLCLPFLAIACSLMICWAMVRCGIPWANKMGMQTNNVDENRNVMQRAINQLEKDISPILPDYGITWTDVQESKILKHASMHQLEKASLKPDAYIRGTLAHCKPLALKMCMHRLKTNASAAKLWEAVELTWEEFNENPQFLARNVEVHQGLSEAAIGEMRGALVQLFVHRAFVWKLRASFKTHLDMEVAADAVANAHQSTAQLQQLMASKILFDRTVKKVLQDVKDDGDVDEEVDEILDHANLDLGLFTKSPTLSELVSQSVPVLWVTLLALWPELLAKFLQMIWCTSISRDLDGRVVVEQRLLPHPDVVCWSSDHFAMAAIAVAGLFVWCTLLPLALFQRIHSLEDRQNTESFRCYGYFIQGYEPKYWWWDILVKRTDIGLMNLVTYTAITSDEKAKLLLFPFFSGCMLAVASWYQPFINTQAEILDFIEMALLSFRFFLFSMVAILLIFHPSAEATFGLAAALVLVLSSACGYFGLHVLAQLLRHSDHDDDSSDSDSEDEKPKKKKCSGQALLRALLSLVQAGEEEKLMVQWSMDRSDFRVVNLAEYHGRYRRRRGFNPVALLKQARAWVFRFGSIYDRRSVAKAFDEFTFMWLDDFGESTLPADVVQVLSVLTTASKHLTGLIPPEKLAEKWQDEVHRLLNHQEVHVWHFTPDEILSTATRISKLSSEDAAHLVAQTQKALQEQRERFSTPTIFHEESQEAEPEVEGPEERSKDQAVQTVLTKEVREESNKVE